MIRNLSIYIIGWVMLVILFMMPFNILGQQSYRISVEFSFNADAVPNKTVAGYRLYKAGEQLCEVPPPVDMILECVFISDPGIYNFTMATVYDDDTLSPSSAEYSFNLTDDMDRPEAIGGFSVERISE